MLLNFSAIIALCLSYYGWSILCFYSRFTVLSMKYVFSNYVWDECMSKSRELSTTGKLVIEKHFSHMLNQLFWISVYNICMLKSEEYVCKPNYFVRFCFIRSFLVSFPQKIILLFWFSSLVWFLSVVHSTVKHAAVLRYSVLWNRIVTLLFLLDRSYLMRWVFM